MSRVTSLCIVFSALAVSACANGPSSASGPSASGNKAPTSSAASSTGTDTGGVTGASGAVSTGPSVTSFSPAPGTVTSLPSSIQVTFSSSSMDSATATATLNYALSCTGGLSYHASSVTLSGAVATVKFSNLPALATGSSCMLSVANGILDTSSGQTLSGSYTATYSVISAGSGASGASSSTPLYNPSWGSPLYDLGSVGGTGGYAFTEDSYFTYALKGFYLRAGSYIDNIQPIWENNYQPLNFTANYYNGSRHGGTGGSYYSMACNDTNARVVGIFGRGGTFIDQLGIICQSQVTLDPGSIWYSTTVGGSGGNSFVKFCPAGTFVVRVKGATGDYVDSLDISCQ